MKKNKIFFRADGSSEIGLGHLIRCLSLAQMIDSEFDIAFVTKTQPPTDWLKLIYDLGYEWFQIINESEIEQFVKTNQVVVVDHYGLGLDYHLSLKKLGIFVVCIDDIHDKVYGADLIINHAPGIAASDYKTDDGINTKFLLGPEFALLRPNFLKRAAAFFDQNSVKYGMFICFGGSDFKNLTCKFLEFLQTMKYSEKIIVVTGSKFPYEAELHQILENRILDIQHFDSLTAFEMEKFISKSQIAFAPSSTILYELFACRTGVISGFYTENQEKIHAGFKSLSCMYTLNDLTKTSLFDFQHLLENVNSEENDLQISRQIQTIDGQSDNRIKHTFIEMFS